MLSAGQLAVEPRGDAQAAVLGQLGAERDERGAQAEVVERLRAQPPHELADLLDGRARRRLERAQRRAQLVGRRALERLELEHDAGQRLADLVVQLARHPPALLLLGVERAPRAVAPLALEPVEHVVERHAQLGHLGHGTIELDALARRQRVDPAHQRGQALERPEHAPHQHEVDGQDDARRRAASTTTSLRWMLELTVAGERASATAAATSTAALIAKTRQNSDTTP